MSTFWFILAAAVVLSIILSLLFPNGRDHGQAPSPRPVKLNPSDSDAEKPNFFSRTLYALVIFVFAVALSMASDYAFGNVKNEIAKLHDYQLYYYPLGFHGISVLDLLTEVLIALVTSFCLGYFAKSRTVNILAALVGVMISGWFWHHCR
jgi:hypothetical protein